MTQPSPLPPETLEQLSAYLDGQLSQQEQHEVVQRLAVDAVWQAEFASLQAMSELLHELPRRRVPRDFTLTPTMVSIPRFLVFPATVPYSLSSAVAAVLLVALGLRFILDGATQAALSPASSLTYSEAVLQSDESVARLSTPPASALTAPLVADALADVASEPEGMLAQVAAPAEMVTRPPEVDMARVGEPTLMVQPEAGASPVLTASPFPSPNPRHMSRATTTITDDQPQVTLAATEQVARWAGWWLAWGSVVVGIFSGIVSVGTAWMRLQQ